MRIGKEVVDGVVLNPSRVRDEEYLSCLKEELRSKHQRLITKSQKKPLFYIEIKSGY